MSNDEWVSIDEAAARIKRTDRQVRRYVERGRIRSRRRGARVEYNAADIADLARELPQDTPKPQVPRIVPSGALLTQIEQLNQRLEEAARLEGYLRSQLDERPALADQRQLTEELIQVRAERDALREQLTMQQGYTTSQLSAVQSSGRRFFILALVVIVGLLILLAFLLFR